MTSSSKPDKARLDAFRHVLIDDLLRERNLIQTEVLVDRHGIVQNKEYIIVSDANVGGTAQDRGNQKLQNVDKPHLHLCQSVMLAKGRKFSFPC